MTSGEVVVVGAINADFVVAANRLPGPGETVVGPRYTLHGGGKGANAAVAAARAGAKVRLVGAVGADATGRGMIEDLRGDGVDVTSVAVLDGEASGVALIVVDPKGENQIAVGAGANAAVTPQQVAQTLGDLNPGCVLVSTEIPEEAVVAAVETAISRGVRCVLNPAPVVPAVVRLLARGPIVTPNSTELEDLTEAIGHDGPTIAAKGDGLPSAFAKVAEDARRLVALTHAPVVVTMGGDGALIVTPDGQAKHVPAPRAVVKDTTGAGDTFNGVLAARLAAGDELLVAVRTAIVAASLSVAHVGARAGMPSAAVIAAELGA